MRLDEYRHHLQEQGLPGDGIEKRMAIVRDFVAFLTTPASSEIPAAAGKEEVRRLARRLSFSRQEEVANQMRTLPEIRSRQYDQKCV